MTAKMVQIIWLVMVSQLVHFPSALPTRKGKPCYQINGRCCNWRYSSHTYITDNGLSRKARHRTWETYAMNGMVNWKNVNWNPMTALSRKQRMIDILLGKQNTVNKTRALFSVTAFSHLSRLILGKSSLEYFTPSKIKPSGSSVPSRPLRQF